MNVCELRHISNGGMVCAVRQPVQSYEGNASSATKIARAGNPIETDCFWV